MHRLIRAVPAVVLLAASLAPRHCAAQSDDAQTVLDKAVETYQGIQSLHEKVTQHLQYRGVKVVLGTAGTQEIDVKFQRPNKAYIKSVSTVNGKKTYDLMVCNGKKQWYYSSRMNTYMVVNVPNTQIGVQMVAMMGLPELQAVAQVPNPFNSVFMLPMGSWTLADDDSVDPQQSDVLSSVFAGVQLMGFDTGMFGEARLVFGKEDHLLHGATVNVRRDDPDYGPPANINMKAEYTQIETNPTFTDADFRFIPPKGAKATSLTKLIQAAAAKVRQEAARKRARAAKHGG